MKRRVMKKRSRAVKRARKAFTRRMPTGFQFLTPAQKLQVFSAPDVQRAAKKLDEAIQRAL